MSRHLHHFIKYFLNTTFKNTLLLNKQTNKQRMCFQTLKSLDTPLVFTRMKIGKVEMCKKFCCLIFIFIVTKVLLLIYKSEHHTVSTFLFCSKSMKKKLLPSLSFCTFEILSLSSEKNIKNKNLNKYFLCW